MREFCDLSPGAIELFGGFRCHLFAERLHCRRMFDSHHTSRRSLRATLVLKRTRLTIRCRCSIAVFDSTFALMFADPWQCLVGWTSKCIRCLIVSELVGIKRRLDTASS